MNTTIAHFAKTAFDAMLVSLRVVFALIVITGPLLALPALGAGDELHKSKGGGAVLLATLQRGRL